jgi:cysteine desulfurase / selenocysteine lyase
MNSFSNVFPVLKKYSYLDNAATSLKPVQLIEKMSEYYLNNSSNVHRGIFKLSEQATEDYEKTRENTAKFFNSEANEVIFTKNTTESINLLSYSLSHNLTEKDLIQSTIMEHHSNLVPWQFLSQLKKVKLNLIDLDEDKVNLNYAELEENLKKDKPKILTFTHISNVLGTINDVNKICSLCNDLNITTIIDGAQSTPHIKIDFKKINCDYFAFSAHKMLGPTGLGVLIGKQNLLKEMPPFITGGSMISSVQRDSFKTANIPQKFEGGTPPIAEVIGFNESLKYISKLGFDKINSIEKDLHTYILKRASELDFIEVYSNTEFNSTGIFTFNVKNVSPHDVASILDEFNVCIRAGNHCAQPLHNYLGIKGSVRASMYFYNTKEDIDKLIEGLKKVEKLFIQ